MKIALVQYNSVWNNKEKSIESINALIKNLEKKTECLIFPEMTLTGFTMDSKTQAEEIDGIGIKYFMDLAQRKRIEIFAGIIEKDGNKFYNSLYHFNSWGLIQAVYRKIHPFSLGDENLHFSAGNEIVVSTINKTKIGLSICYDLRFPELYRLSAKEKVDVMINIANWPIKRIHHWKALLRARAIENQFFMIGVNRVGDDPFHQYNGCSAIFNTMGDKLILVENEEKIIYAELNLAEVKTTRKKLPFLDDIKLI